MRGDEKDDEGVEELSAKMLAVKPLVGGRHDNRQSFVDKMNKNLSDFIFHDKLDDISESCYKHWLASSDNACEVNPVITNERLALGPFETPMASKYSIYGIQIDGGQAFRGMYWVDETTILNRSTLQRSKAYKKLSYELLSTAYLIRVFKLEKGVWKISPLGVYYQLTQYGGIKRYRVTVTSTSSQTDLSGKELDELINKRAPES